MFCMLCDELIIQPISWKQLIRKRQQESLCETCVNKFSRVLKEQQRYENVEALYHYNDIMKYFLHRYKFYKDIRLKYAFSEQLRQVVKKYEYDMLVPIPIHPLKEKERTFSHVEQLLKAANLSYDHVLIKTENVTQALKNRRERLQTSSFFRVHPEKNIKNKKIILIDDMITTGITLKYAKDILEKKGAYVSKSIVLILGEHKVIFN